jgi:hypothetical protein
MGIAELKETFPQLRILADTELETAVASGGLLRALILSHVRALTAPRRVGRPRKAPKPKVVIQRRGRKGVRLSPNSTNIQLAELAKAYADCLECSFADAAEATLIELTGKSTPRDTRKLAKLISELPGRQHDRAMRARGRQHGNEIYGAFSDLSVSELLKRYQAR